MPYSGNPASSDRDQVRFLVGDTDNEDLQLQDAEIDFLIAQEGVVEYAAALAAEALIAKYSHEVTYSAGRISRQLAGRADALRKLAAQLRASAAKYPVPVDTGAFPDADLADASSGRKQPLFVIAQFDNPEATRPASIPGGFEEEGS